MRLHPLPFLLCAALLPASQVNRTETRTEALPMGAKLWIDQGDGKVDVKGWDREEVEVVAEFVHGSGRGEATLELRRVAEGLEIHVNHPHRRHFAFFMVGTFREPLCHLTLRVPRKLSMDVRTVDGGIAIRDLEGYAGCHSVDGNITLQDLSGEVHAHTVDGSISAQNLKARVKGGTVDGNITLNRVEGGLDLQTVDGSIQAEDLDGWGEGIAFKTVDGKIRVKLGHAKGKLDAKSVDGTIRSTLTGMERSKSGSLTGHILGRDQPLTFRTVDGSIDID